MNLHTFYIGRVQDFNRFLASFRAQADRDKPTLYFMHVLMPHGPWLYTADGRLRAVSTPARRGGRTSSGGAPTSRSRRGSGT